MPGCSDTAHQGSAVCCYDVSEGQVLGFMACPVLALNYWYAGTPGVSELDGDSVAIPVTTVTEISIVE